MPLPERLTKDCKHLIKYCRYYLENKFSNKTIFVYPHYPSSGSTLYKIAKCLHYNITNIYQPNLQGAIYWEYQTLREEYHFLESLASQGMQIINLYSRDISKVYVGQVFFKVFGYSINIDPSQYQGKVVEKSDINAMHDGRIIMCPVKKIKENHVYQILIDNSYQDDQVKDIRVPIVKETLDFVYLKYRKIEERFKNTTIQTKLENINQILTEDEISKLNLFCKEVSLDYGELDVLRDKVTGKVFIVDVNNTPQGPPANISKADGKKALGKIAEAFGQAIKIEN